MSDALVQDPVEGAPDEEEQAGGEAGEVMVPASSGPLRRQRPRPATQGCIDMLLSFVVRHRVELARLAFPGPPTVPIGEDSVPRLGCLRKAATRVRRTPRFRDNHAAASCCCITRAPECCV
jgi:hypothetical protein